MIVVVKIGTSSITESDGTIKAEAVAKLSGEVAAAIADGHQAVVVSSGAIGAGLPVLGFDQGRPRDSVTLQALSAVGQSRLMALYQECLEGDDLVCGQVLLAPRDFLERTQYLHAQRTLNRLLKLGVVPIVNENDAVADDAIRWGDNDRIAALVAHMVGADVLVLLTDTDGVHTADPRIDAAAPVVEEITDLGQLEELTAAAGGAGTDRGSGGMASKLAAARIASWSGVRTVIAAADRPQVVADALARRPGVGSTVVAQPQRLSARKLWIGFAMVPSGTLRVDAGARRAMVEQGASLLAIGITGFDGTFQPGDAVDLRGPDDEVFARGLVEIASHELGAVVGLRSDAMPPGAPDEVIHRDSLTVLP
ncbi:glutamate 5-kinase [Candidatus Poriferisocius sp.]|uniref:glutamate 5-kinase n=1 Tax=Candidatus Poriferisocius sp. TaxID=3101276 RepID=UPI003B5C0CCB